MSDRVFFSLAALTAIVMIALALVWPQGQGARLPGPFGGPLAQPAPVPATAAPSPAAPAPARAP